MVGWIGMGGGFGRKGRFLVNFAVALKSGVSDWGSRVIARGSVWFMIVMRAVWSTCIIMALGVGLSQVLAWLGTKVTSSTGEEVVAVVVFPLPKRRGGARFLEASHGNTIILRRDSHLTSRRGKGRFGVTGCFWDSSFGEIGGKCKGTRNSQVHSRALIDSS